jgi:hypothetical protein
MRVLKGRKCRFLFFKNTFDYEFVTLVDSFQNGKLAANVVKLVDVS